MIANYHTHTFRCHHANGTEEEYVERAIEGGLKILGFSDHAPFAFPDGHQSGYRVRTEEAEDYIQTINALKEKYKDIIEIFVGFEMEYYPAYFDDMLSYIKKLGAEYLILGQHFIVDEYPVSRYSMSPNNTLADLKDYVDCVIEGMKSGAFSYVAHPDIVRYDSQTEDYYNQMKRLCIEAKKLDIPLEINFLGISDKRIYPNPQFFRIAGEVGNKVIFGSDAHNAKSVFAPHCIEIAEKFVSDFGLSKIDTLNFKKL